MFQRYAHPPTYLSFFFRSFLRNSNSGKTKISFVSSVKFNILQKVYNNYLQEMEIRELLHALHEDAVYSFEDRRYPIRIFYSPFSYWVIMITMDELEQLHDLVE